MAGRFATAARASRERTARVDQGGVGSAPCGRRKAWTVKVRIIGELSIKFKEVTVKGGKPVSDASDTDHDIVAALISLYAQVMFDHVRRDDPEKGDAEAQAYAVRETDAWAKPARFPRAQSERDPLREGVYNFDPVGPRVRPAGSRPRSGVRRGVRRSPAAGAAVSRGGRGGFCDGASPCASPEASRPDDCGADRTPRCARAFRTTLAPTVKSASGRACMVTGRSPAGEPQVAYSHGGGGSMSMPNRPRAGRAPWASAPPPGQESVPGPWAAASCRSLAAGHHLQPPAAGELARGGLGLRDHQRLDDRLRAPRAPRSSISRNSERSTGA